MQNLINELMNPASSEDGSTIPVTMVKRRAAKAIEQLYNNGQADLQERIKLQLEVAELRQTLIELNGPPLDYCLADYKHVMNEDYNANFT